MSAVLFQNMPPLSPEEYAALEQSIIHNGIQVPILLDERGTVIDGHHRQKIAQHLGVDCPSRTVTGKSEAEKRTLALSLNLDRRHLTREQRRTLAVESLKADPGLSNRQHAERVGLHHETIQSVRGPLEATGEIRQSVTRLSADGRERPATQPATERIDPSTGEVLDGKTYPRPEPQQQPAQKRRPLPDAFREGVYQLRLKAESLERLTRDDRFAANKEKTAQTELRRLINTRDLINQVIDQLS